jgi:hypothetical protein
VTIIGVIDDHSRRSLGHYAAAGETGEAAWACFVKAVNKYGLPARVLTDNGTSFNARRRGWEVEFTYNLTALGVIPISSGNYHPQTNGKCERSHRTLKRWLAKLPPAESIPGLQDQLDIFDGAYDDRPHQSLSGRTPAERWNTATTEQPGQAPAPHSRVATVTVDGRGSVAIGGRYQAQVGRRWTGVTVTVITQGERVAIFHGNTLVRELTIDPTRRYQPTGQPRGGRRHPRVLSGGQ